MSQLFQRAVALNIDGLLVTGLRAQFKVKKTQSKEPNTCEVSLYNLSAPHRASIHSKGTPFVLEAGYEDTVAQIFSGQTSYVDHTHEKADWITKIQCNDGERAYRFAIVREAYRAGTPVADVFSRVAGALGIDVTQATALVRAQVRDQFPQGYTVWGRASQEVDRILAARGFEWSIQDGKLQVVLAGQTLPGNAVTLSSGTGLIGSPAYGSPVVSDQTATLGEPKPVAKKQVLKAKSLLQPALKPGARVQLSSRAVTGLFRVEATIHTGDTHSGEWYSEVDLRAVSGAA